MISSAARRKILGVLTFGWFSSLVQFADERHQVVHGGLLDLIVVLPVHHYPGYVVVRRVQRLRLGSHGVLQSVTLWPLGTALDSLIGGGGKLVDAALSTHDWVVSRLHAGDDGDVEVGVPGEVVHQTDLQ